ncbi:O-methyltransferase [Leptolyngbya sp. 7M]|uniref:O-methyltransferase n=1 Tax=Leptolyngbya sp. 7M TaxID=2812896 RepID=UPI001B8C0868|nr:O-methyltransferase [Leptolyngbya sp. 7M]QYO65469.1 O-methyltransferase [Leptolyngbya sp. 7M]
MNEIKNSLTEYAEAFTSGESEVLRELREYCFAHYKNSSMLSGFYQGRLLSMLSHMIQPRKVLEIGTYLGYSTICLAEGLAEGGEVISLDINEETNHVAQSFIDKTEFRDRIQLRLGDAIFMLPHVAGPYDLVFIDADKQNYSNYYNLVLDKVRPGGFIVADNVLWSGRVLEEEKDEDTQALHEYNQMVLTDDRVESLLLPIRDGLMVVRKLL